MAASSIEGVPRAGGGSAEGESSLRPLLVFRCGPAWLAVDAPAVEEVVEDANPTPLPHAPVHVPGLVIIRGRAVPLFSLARFFSLDAPEEQRRGDSADDEFRRLLVVRSGEIQVGIRTGRVRGVLEAVRENLARPEAFASGRLSEFVEAQVDDPAGVIAVLALDRLLEAARIRA